jgi:hypothetical protein
VAKLHRLILPTVLIAGCRSRDRDRCSCQWRYARTRALGDQPDIAFRHRDRKRVCASRCVPRSGVSCVGGPAFAPNTSLLRRPNSGRGLRISRTGAGIFATAFQARPLPPRQCDTSACLTASAASDRSAARQQHRSSWVHNHPSGNPTPSPEDLSFTEQSAAAGNIVGVPVDDHVIIGRDRYISFKEEGWL